MAISGPAGGGGAVGAAVGGGVAGGVVGTVAVVTGTAAAGIVVAGVVVVGTAVVVAASVVEGSVRGDVANVVDASKSSRRSVTSSSSSARDWAISFGFSSAVARLAAANTEAATRTAAPTAIARRGAGSLAARSPRHHRPT